MRPLARLAAVLTLLAACQTQAPALGDGPGDATSPLVSDAIAVTTLDGVPADSAPADKAATPAATKPAQDAAIPVQVPGKTTPRPAARPAVPAPQASVPAASPTPANAEPATSEPAAPVSPEQALCEKTKGQWSALDSSTGHVCVHTTRDSGKSCHRKRDCQGECLAQSGTCSPIMPLMGCNDILQADGTEVTLCLQ